MSDLQLENDGFGNWCPDCGEMRGVCRCEEDRATMQRDMEYAIYKRIDQEDREENDDTYTDQDAENHICPKCHGRGIWIDDIEPCDHCDGLGYEWWIP